jgi:hypothetical protein
VFIPERLWISESSKVWRLAPHLAASGIDVAIRHCTEQRNQLDNESVRLCIRLAGLIEQSFVNIADTSTAAEVVALPSSPGALIGSDVLAFKIQPWVEKVRREIFGRPDPPFTTREEAANWLAESGHQTQIEKASQEMAKATGFSQAPIEEYILIGISPFLSNIELKIQNSVYQLPIPGGETLKRTHATINVYWITSDKHFRMAEREMRKALNFSKVKELTKSDRRLLELVKQVGEPPAKGSNRSFARSTAWSRS